MDQNQKPSTLVKLQIRFCGTSPGPQPRVAQLFATSHDKWNSRHETGQQNQVPSALFVQQVLSQGVSTERAK